MLKINNTLVSDEESAKTASLEAGPRNFYLRVFRHQMPIMIVFMVLSLALAILYLVTTVPIYVATAAVVIDASKAQMLDPQPSAHYDTHVDESTVQTEIELIKSDNVSRAVIKKLRLGDDPEFAGEPPGLIGDLFNRVRGLFSSSTLDPKQAEVRQEKIVLGTFKDKVTATRSGKSYIIEISVQSSNPDKAALIANAIADAYLDNTLNSKYEVTRRASVWLQDRLKELREQAATQQQAVVDFRKTHNIIGTGGSNGQLMNDQQLSEVNTQLVLAQAATAEAKARYDRIREVMKQDVPDASITDALNNQVIIKLRGQYLEAAGHESIWSQKYGPNHLSVITQRTQMRELQRAIKDEMAKIEQSYKSDYEIALAREQSLQKSLGNAISQSQLTNQAQVQLRELESAAQTSKSLHDNFLSRYMEGIQAQSFPITETRIVETAEAPLSKSFPKTSLILLLAVVGGGALSFGIGALREIFDRVFRSSEQVEEELQVDCLAMLPLLKQPAANLAERAASVAAAAPAAAPVLVRAQTMFDIVLDQPFSEFSEALRTVKVTSDLSGILKTKKITGVISTLPNEGKTTVAANYAQLIAHGGSRTLLIDADLRNPTLSCQLAPQAPGLIDLLAGWKSLEEVLLTDPRSGLRFLPSGPKSNMPHTNELLASDAMKKVITVLQETYDYIIVDLPPLIPVVDARASTHFIDAYLCTVEWGSTKVDLVRHALLNAPEIYERLLGVILNKVDMNTIGRYERFRHNYYYEKYRSRYGNLDPSAQASERSAKGEHAL